MSAVRRNRLTVSQSVPCRRRQRETAMNVLNSTKSILSLTACKPVSWCTLRTLGRLATSSAVCLGTLCAGCVVHAQERQEMRATALSPALKTLGSFLSVGAYFPTASTGRAALGDAKFHSDSTFFTRPKAFGPIRLTGGLEYMSAGDHLLPFSGGSQLSLLGPAASISTIRLPGRIRPYLTAGLFAGRLRSERLHFDRTDFTPSAAVGLEYPFARYFTLTASYRLTERIHGVDTSGFSVGIKIF